MFLKKIMIFIGEVWNSETPFHQHTSVILRFMERLDIIAKQRTAQNGSTEVNLN